ncbi:MAG: 3-hydroxyacyl-CoA dehydrogenase NAD-binding domain-containing protein [Cytophagales bacterium]|nr:3-hydroxyacyl-CoA dehydrogenase NAD-binding domain-containing protein [Cytophagales bacterium]
MPKNKRVAVIGAGTMGNGIAHVFASCGHEVFIVDLSRDALDRALGSIEKNLDRQVKKGIHRPEHKKQTLSRLKISENLKEAVSEASLVIEAVSEKISVKADIFEQLDRLSPPDCILASNTSSLSITEIASHTRRKDKVIGMHFMNPVPVMKLVEVIRGYFTANKVVEEIFSLIKVLNKTPVLSEDYPGFVANRILMPMINEAIYALHEGVAKVEDIDEIMRLGMAHPMGPLQLADFIGLDICLSILKVLHEGFGQSKYAPCPLLVNMVKGGALGRKTGRGFYTYD